MGSPPFKHGPDEVRGEHEADNDRWDPNCVSLPGNEKVLQIALRKWESVKCSLPWLVGCLPPSTVPLRLLPPLFPCSRVASQL